MNTLGRLEKCPECNYKLTGLPGIHRCPECGFAYDKGSFVLSATGKFGFGNWVATIAVVNALLSVILNFFVFRRSPTFFEWATITIFATGGVLGLRAYLKHWHASQYLLASPEGLMWRLRGFESVSLKWSEISRIGLDNSRKKIVVSRVAGGDDFEVPRRFISKGKSAEEISRILCEQLASRTRKRVERTA